MKAVRRHLHLSVVEKNYSGGALRWQGCQVRGSKGHEVRVPSAVLSRAKAQVPSAEFFCWRGGGGQGGVGGGGGARLNIQRPSAKTILSYQTTYHATGFPGARPQQRGRRIVEFAHGQTC